MRDLINRSGRLLTVGHRVRSSREIQVCCGMALEDVDLIGMLVIVVRSISLLWLLIIILLWLLLLEVLLGLLVVVLGWRSGR